MNSPSKIESLISTIDMKYRHHSVITRIVLAAKEGRDEITVFRPRGTVSSEMTTDNLIVVLGSIGLKVKMRPGTLLARNFTVSGIVNVFAEATPYSGLQHVAKLPTLKRG